MTLFFAAAFATSALAQAPAIATPTTAATSTVVTDSDSHETREAFHATLRRYPTEVSRVLKLDPSLMTNQSYLGNYPALGQFLAQHPEIAHSPAFFLDDVYVGDEPRGENSSERVWRSTMEGLSIFAVLALVTGVLTWLVRTMIEHRRWSRISKVQADVHNKLMDRFTANEDLLAYIQTPAGNASSIRADHARWRAARRQRADQPHPLVRAGWPRSRRGRLRTGVRQRQHRKDCVAAALRHGCACNLHRHRLRPLRHRLVRPLPQAWPVGDGDACQRDG